MTCTSKKTGVPFRSRKDFYTERDVERTQFQWSKGY